MHETMAQWDFVAAAYGVVVPGLGALILWTLLAMRRAEKRRDAARDSGRGRSKGE